MISPCLLSELISGAYILIWPFLTLWILLIFKAVLKDVREAEKENRDLVQAPVSRLVE
ncbi:hypothetical protein [Oceanisphaera psychrotolerans]|uniref:hypothetical protein n=1 Tax=Oceanisphaera psychrotolerans TaxID=1414654 RepID=UPI0015871525|nr:hypothetical protein [Oceanisphaera psychrotolerans]